MSRRAAVIGVGLMGGSLGMALRSRGWRVTGIGRDAARLRRARTRGALDEMSLDPAQGVAGADVVVLAAPVDKLVPLGRSLRPFVKPGALIMDMGSVKMPVAKAFADELQAARSLWDELRLTYLSDNASGHVLLTRALRENGFQTQAIETGRNLFVSLNTSWEAYYNTRTRSLKKANNLAANRLKKRVSSRSNGCNRITWIRPSLTAL